MYRSALKRFLDFLFSFAVILLLLPLFVAVYLLLRLSGKPLFLQERVGMNGKAFKIFKFRTMTDRPRVFDKQVVEGDSEVTLLGGVLRRFKIDELPQVFNVLMGDMSIVGPRPCLPTLVKEFNEDGHYRLRVRPGLTGLAQINGNIHLSWEERWKYDREYAENMSFLLDLSIVARTVSVVLFGEGRFINRPGK